MATALNSVTTPIQTRSDFHPLGEFEVRGLRAYRWLLYTKTLAAPLLAFKRNAVYKFDESFPALWALVDLLLVVCFKLIVTYDTTIATHLSNTSLLSFSYSLNTRWYDLFGDDHVIVGDYYVTTLSVSA
ncbi:MAG: hypothetical protein LBI74_00130 [Synergistaceae bacterium]|nr:hypothetical protein [Synergistaceae bacterium]